MSRKGENVCQKGGPGVIHLFPFVFQSTYSLCTVLYKEAIYPFTPSLFYILLYILDLLKRNRQLERAKWRLTFLAHFLCNEGTQGTWSTASLVPPIQRRR